MRDSYEQLLDLATGTALRHQPDGNGVCAQCGVPDCDTRRLAELARRQYARNMTAAPADMSPELATLLLEEHQLDDSGLCTACRIAPCRVRRAAQLLLGIAPGWQP